MATTGIAGAPWRRTRAPTVRKTRPIRVGDPSLVPNQGPEADIGKPTIPLSLGRPPAIPPPVITPAYHCASSQCAALLYFFQSGIQ